MRECPSSIPTRVDLDLNPSEVGIVVLVHVPSLDGELDWIVDEQIDGSSFQNLNHELLKDFGISKFSNRNKILRLQIKVTCCFIFITDLVFLKNFGNIQHPTSN
jgi:hypothetical protein